MVEETFVFDDPGCYTFTVYDTGGDGLQSGFILLYYGTNHVILKVLEFESLVQTQFDVGGTVHTEEINPPVAFKFYPNPVYDEGYMALTLDEDSFVEATIYNPLGQKVMEVTHCNFEPGYHQVSYFSGNLGPGLYIISVQIGERVITQKIIKQ
jgi:hypothetical protein